MPTTFESLPNEVILDYIGNELDLRSMAAISETSRRYSGLFEGNLAKAKQIHYAKKILALIEEGKRIEVEALLKDNPSSLTTKVPFVSFTDGRGLLHMSISPWEYSLSILVAFDNNLLHEQFMCDMMLKYIPLDNQKLRNEFMRVYIRNYKGYGMIEKSLDNKQAAIGSLLIRSARTAEDLYNLHKHNEKNNRLYTFAASGSYLHRAASLGLPLALRKVASYALCGFYRNREESIRFAIKCIKTLEKNIPDTSPYFEEIQDGIGRIKNRIPDILDIEDIEEAVKSRINELSDVPEQLYDLPDSVLAIQKESLETGVNWFDILPVEVIQSLIGSRLGSYSMASLAFTSTRNHEIFKEELTKNQVVHQTKKQAQRMLALISKGKRTEVETLLKDNPSILTTKVSFTESKEKFYESISPWEYSFSILEESGINLVHERFMCDMMLPYLSQEQHQQRENFIKVYFEKYYASAFVTNELEKKQADINQLLVDTAKTADDIYKLATIFNPSPHIFPFVTINNPNLLEKAATLGHPLALRMVASRSLNGCYANREDSIRFGLSCIKNLDASADPSSPYYGELMEGIGRVKERYADIFSAANKEEAIALRMEQLADTPTHRCSELPEDLIESQLTADESNQRFKVSVRAFKTSSIAGSGFFSSSHAAETSGDSRLELTSEAGGDLNKIIPL